MKQVKHKIKSGLVVNGEERLALKNLVEQHRAEIDILKKNANAISIMIIELNKDFNSLKQEYSLMKAYLDRKMK
jgi:succinate dehydrogenase/fumarate reductase-like Fe-S protein